MQDLSRESILRMIGLHDAAHLSRQLNAIQLSLEEESGKMVTYWTEIRKTEKEVTLIAGRMDDAETDIAQLQVTAGQISANVSSLQTTVGGHTTQIGQLQITTQNLTASVSSLTTTVNGHTTSISQLTITTNSISQDVSNISDEVDVVSGTVTTHTSQISTLRTDLNGISATVTADHTTLGTHTTQIGSLQVTANSISGRVTAIEGDYVKNAQISLMVVKDGNGYISNALIDADDIKFVFTRAVSWYWQSEQEANKRMGLDSSGDLWIAGELRGGTIHGNYTIGSLGTKMEIYVDETVGSMKCSGIRAHDSNNWEVIRLGMLEYSNRVEPSLRLNNPSVDQVYVRPEFIQFQHIVNTGVTSVFTIGWSSTTNKILIGSPLDAWPSLSNVSVGQVYLDNGYLKVRTS